MCENRLSLRNTARSMPPRATFKFRIRIERGADVALGPGKVALLEAIVETGSITAAAARLGMSYRRAWLLVDDLNRCFREPLVAAQVGGVKGGGASLTGFGHAVIEHYRAIEKAAETAGAAHVGALTASLAEPS